MRHCKKLKKLGLKHSHRESLIKNLVASLVLHEKIRTTESRAKVLAARFGRIMRAAQKKEKREAIRAMSKYCFIKKVSEKVINELKTRYKDKTSGFTRITRIGMRKGDNAKLVQIELV